MSRLQPVLLIVIVVLITACGSAAVTPTLAPEPLTPAAPPPTDSGVISTTPLPPGFEQLTLPAPYAPQPIDATLQRGNAFVDSAQIIATASFPPQFFLSLGGSLPTPCHGLRVNVARPSGQNRITVDVYSVTDPNASCVQALEPFNVNVRLGTFPAGQYEVWVNGQPVGEIEAP